MTIDLYEDVKGALLEHVELLKEDIQSILEAKGVGDWWDKLPGKRKKKVVQILGLDKNLTQKLFSQIDAEDQSEIDAYFTKHKGRVESMELGESKTPPKVQDVFDLIEHWLVVGFRKKGIRDNKDFWVSGRGKYDFFRMLHFAKKGQGHAPKREMITAGSLTIKTKGGKGIEPDTIEVRLNKEPDRSFKSGQEKQIAEYIIQKVAPKYESVELGEASKSPTFEKDDIVRYTKKFLRNTGQYTGAPINGKVVGFVKMGGVMFPTVKWSDGRETPVNPVNLELDHRYRKKMKEDMDLNESQMVDFDSFVKQVFRDVRLPSKPLYSLSDKEREAIATQIYKKNVGKKFAHDEFQNLEKKLPRIEAAIFDKYDRIEKENNDKLDKELRSIKSLKSILSFVVGSLPSRWDEDMDLDEAATPLQKFTAKHVKAWAKKIGVKKPRVKSFATRGTWVELYSPGEPIPVEARKKLVVHIGGKPGQTSYGNIQEHFAVMRAEKWLEFLGITFNEDVDLEEEVRAGQYFVLVDISVPGGKLVKRKLYHGVKEADKEAAKLNKDKYRVQVIDAMWYEPARAIMKTQGMIGEDVSNALHERIFGEATRLPIVKIDGKKYYRDDRLKEYRCVDDPHDRISFKEVDKKKIRPVSESVDLFEDIHGALRKRVFGDGK